MDMDMILMSISVITLGSLTLYGARLAQSGYVRGLYFLSVPGMYVMGHVYAAIPFGTGLVLIGIFSLLHSILPLDNLYISMLGVCFVAGIIFIAWQPRFLKPWWLIWLEDNYHGIERGALLEVAGRNPNKFAQLTPDEASLKAWAESTLDELRNPPGK